MTPRVRSVVNCPRCSAENRGTDHRCRVCSRTLTIRIGPASPLPRRLSVGAMMGVVLATAPGLAVVRESDFLGLWTLAVLVPATLRTLAEIGQAKEDGRTIDVATRLGLFTRSVLMMLATTLCAGIVAAILSIPLIALTAEFGVKGPMIGNAFAVAIGLVVGGLILRSYWPSRV